MEDSTPLVGPADGPTHLLGPEAEQFLSGFRELESAFERESLPWVDQLPSSTFSFRVDKDSASYATDGLVIKESFIPDNLIDAYSQAWLRENYDRPMGFPIDVPYMYIPELLDMLCYRPLSELLEWLIGEPMGVHLNLTGWKSTTRNWHQDGYLNPDSTRDFYAAVWIALDDVHPDSGPFQFVRKSHRLPIIGQFQTLAQLLPEEIGPDWPRHSERFLTPLFETLIAEANLLVEEFLPKKGDILIWHSRLMHRGSVPKNPDLWRRSCIAHYSGIGHRPDMPAPVMRIDGQDIRGHYFPIYQPYERRS